jgi:hypothetical protein
VRAYYRAAGRSGAIVTTKIDADIQAVVCQFEEDLDPLEKGNLFILTDNRTGARYCECHVLASKIIAFATTDVPIDPKQPGYRANRDVVVNDTTFAAMKSDAVKRRAFSNVVTEYTREGTNPEKPLKIIGGQHRYEAIREAHAKEVDELHGLKVYFGLTMSQRIDAQLISNTNVDVSGALGDRIRETSRGPNLRSWCQDVGLLKPGQDFGDKKGRGKPITVDVARTFIQNYFDGKAIDWNQFPNIETTPMLYAVDSPKDDEKWDALLTAHPDVWSDEGLRRSGKEFVRLRDAQRAAFSGQKGKADFSEKAMNAAVLSAWALVSGVLHNNDVRLGRLFSIADAKGKDPLNAEALASGSHGTDSDSYRGLGYRSDPRERGRMTELFWMIAESGGSIKSNIVEVAIYKHYAKATAMDAKKKEAALTSSKAG